MPPSLTDQKTNVPNDFDRVARRYDLLSGLNPGYRRHLKKSAARLGVSGHPRILDLCCGTGLSTEAIASVYPYAAIVALDASAGMIEQARRKRRLTQVNFVLGDATDPTAAGVEGPFDAIFMAYGIRNVPDPDLCLANLLKLLKPGAPIVFHEYSVSDSRWSAMVWKMVSSAVIIPLGKLFAGDADIFRYLRRSVIEFDGKEAFVERLIAAGFVKTTVLPMGGWQRGIVHTFRAHRAAQKRNSP